MIKTQTEMDEIDILGKFLLFRWWFIVHFPSSYERREPRSSKWRLRQLPDLYSVFCHGVIDEFFQVFLG